VARITPPIQQLAGESSLEAFVSFIADDKRRKKYLDELNAVRDKANAAIGDWNKKRTADQLLAEATNAKSQAESAAKKMVEATTKEVESEREKIKRARDIVKKREDGVSQKESKLAESLVTAEREIKDRNKSLDGRQAALETKERAVEVRAKRVEEMLVEYTTLNNRARAALGMEPLGDSDTPKVPAKPPVQ
jgi:CRISPR/Cas system-associated exonuclease Cas4 (RecB family)